MYNNLWDNIIVSSHSNVHHIIHITCVKWWAYISKLV